MVGNINKTMAMSMVVATLMALGTHVAKADENTACFYNDTEFEGAAYCTSAGARKGLVDHLFGKRFRSVELTGTAVVHICEYSGFGGRCMVVEKSQPDLDALYVNNVESYEVLTVESSGARFFNHVGYADSGVHHAGD
jgi:Peptidase inhibitor family I36